MIYKFFKSTISILVVVISICCINDRISFARQNDAGLAENVENKYLRCLQNMADSTINMLIASRSVIAKNQGLINTDPISGNYYFKGFVPARVGTEIANDFSLMTGYKLKQTSLMIRNAANAPDEWEMKVLKRFESPDYPKGAGYGEFMVTGGKNVYKYMKPIYIEKACLECHSTKEKIRPEVRKFLEKRYPNDEALGYKEGDPRGGISIIIPIDNISPE